MGIVFCATLFAYTFQRLVKFKTGRAFSEDRKEWMKNNMKIVLVLLVISFITSIILVIYISIFQTILLVITGILSAFYVSYFIRNKNKGLRDIPYVKVYVVAFVWTILLTIIPLMVSKIDIHAVVPSASTSFFIYILAMAMLFDIKDVHLDEAETRTIPAIAGIKKTQWISFALTCSSLCLLVISFQNIFWPTVVQLSASSMVILLTPRWKKEFYYSLYIDGVLLLPGLMCLTASIF